MQTQAQPRQLRFDHHPGLAERFGGISQESEIIHVAQIGRDAGQSGDGVIEAIEVEVGEELAGEVADRKAAWALQGGEQGVAGEGVDRGAEAGAVGEEAIKQPESAGAVDALRQLGAQDRS